VAPGIIRLGEPETGSEVMHVMGSRSRDQNPPSPQVLGVTKKDPKTNSYKVG